MLRKMAGGAWVIFLRANCSALYHRLDLSLSERLIGMTATTNQIQQQDIPHSLSINNLKLPAIFSSSYLRSLTSRWITWIPYNVKLEKDNPFLERDMYTSM